MENSSKRKRKHSKEVAPVKRGKRTVRVNPYIKYKAQTTQQTYYEEEFEEDLEIDDLEEPIDEEATPEDENDNENLIEYEPEETDIETDDFDFDEDNRDSLFDSTGLDSTKVQPDIILYEICPLEGGEAQEIAVYVTAKRKDAMYDYKIQSEALKAIGNILSEKDRDFLLAESFNPALILEKIQKDIAKVIGKNESWISNLKKTCIVQTPRWGLQPLSIFFPEDIPRDVKEFSSSIKKAIDEEDPFNPLSLKDLASVITETETEYKKLTSNAGSGLRRILAWLNIPIPSARKQLAKSTSAVLNKNRNKGASEIITIVCANKADLKLVMEYYDFTCGLIEKLKRGKDRQ